MNLSQLCFTLDGRLTSGMENVRFLGITCDSRTVKSGDVFFAVPGVKDDGAKYARDAEKNGATGIVCAKELDVTTPQIIVKDVREAMAQAACEFYDHPSRKMGLIGVTGTNGKTTITYILRHLLRSAGHPCGMLGTIQYDLLGGAQASPLTTPHSIDFQKFLNEIHEHGGKYCVAEVSSHALCQKRVAGSDFCAAVFTNLTHDHLDYHGDLDSYAEAKRILFHMLEEGAFAVVNGDDENCRKVLEGCTAEIISYGYQEGCDVRILGHKCDANGSTIKVDYMGNIFDFHSPLCGLYNVYNSVAALTVAAQLGIELKIIAEYFDNFKGVPGRLERIRVAHGGYTVFVDYAHTHDALKKALEAVRPLGKGTLRVVFGCGGDRDPCKRPLMGRVACKYADKVYITNDNPRTEDPDVIVKGIVSGLRGYDNYVIEQDRKKAIDMALRDSEAGDIVLVAGKGHEDYQILGSEKIYFDDCEVIRGLLGLRSYRRK